jgi:hypothetical protein
LLEDDVNVAVMVLAPYWMEDGDSGEVTLPGYSSTFVTLQVAPATKSPPTETPEQSVDVVPFAAVAVKLALPDIGSGIGTTPSLPDTITV